MTLPKRLSEKKQENWESDREREERNENTALGVVFEESLFEDYLVDSVEVCEYLQVW
jgi:hypothetical protein